MNLLSVWAYSKASTRANQSPILQLIFLSVIECESVYPCFDLTLLKLAWQMSGKPIRALLWRVEQCSRLVLSENGRGSIGAEGQMKLSMRLTLPASGKGCRWG